MPDFLNSLRHVYYVFVSFPLLRDAVMQQVVAHTLEKHLRTRKCLWLLVIDSLTQPKIMHP